MTRGRSLPRITYGEALHVVEQLLSDDTRAAALDAIVDPLAVDASLDRLRKAMRSHAFSRDGTELRRVVDALDNRTRREGFHVLQGWDFVAHRFPRDIAPILLVDYCARMGIPPGRAREAASVLLDQYFLALLSLLAIRAWDEGDANENLDGVSRALSQLQTERGSGHEFVGDAETLLMLAVSYFHPEEQGYELLVERVSALDDRHRVRFSIACSALMGFHLRWGLRFMYGRDVGRMRDDNVADYPLLLFAVTTLATEFERSIDRSDRGAITESLLSGLSADPWAFLDTVPRALALYGDSHVSVRRVLNDRREMLANDFASYLPSPRTYSPLSFSCNFPTNATVAMAALAVQGEKHPPINALFRRDSEPASHLARRLMDFATSDPSRLGAGGVPLLAYDPYEGAHAYNTTLRTLRDAASRGSSRS